MQLNLSPLSYTFQDKPLLIGGKAMAYYELRPAGADIDFVVSAEDYRHLASLYPDQTKDLFGDLGVVIGAFELWQSILLFDYGFLSRDALDEVEFKVISLDRLLFLKTLAIQEPKYERDVLLIIEKIHAIQYSKDPHYPTDFFR